MTTQSEPIISVSGLRGIIGQQLTPAVAVRYVSALAATLPTSGCVVIGRDGRSSGPILAQAISATFAAHGLDAINLDVASAPTVGVEVRERNAVAGVQISASHNPKQYNGLKLFGSDGRVLPRIAGEKVLASYRASNARWVAVDDLGECCDARDIHSAHARLVLDTVDIDDIRNRKFKVLLDSNHGAGSVLGGRLLGELGCETTLLGDTPDGMFEHIPEPLAENLTSVCDVMKKGDFDIGFCQDPDADRLAVIDENGDFIGEELTLALCLMQALPKEQGIVVTNCATSSLARFVAEKNNCKLLQSAVGEANVADLMISEKAVFGGEGNGGPIDPKVGYVRDSFVGMARILELLATSGEPVSRIVAQLPPLSIIKDKIDLDTTELPRLFDLLTSNMADATASRPDGLKLDWGDRWLLVRGSNTEPIVRLIAEAPTSAEARDLCQQGREIASKL